MKYQRDWMKYVLTQQRAERKKQGTKPYERDQTVSESVNVTRKEDTTKKKLSVIPNELSY